VIALAVTCCALAIAACGSSNKSTTPTRPLLDQLVLGGMRHAVDADCMAGLSLAREAIA
jgi:hypothetical protein